MWGEDIGPAHLFGAAAARGQRGGQTSAGGPFNGGPFNGGDQSLLEMRKLDGGTRAALRRVVAPRASTPTVIDEGEESDSATTAGTAATPKGAAPSSVSMSPLTASPSSPLSPLAGDLAWRDCLIDVDQIQVLRKPDGSPWKLGGGAYGTVYKAIYDQVQVVAVKVLVGIRNDPHQLESVLQEGRILRDCRDKNIVQFVGICMGWQERVDGEEAEVGVEDEADAVMLVVEFMEAGDLFRVLRWRDQAGRRVFGWYQRGRRAAQDAVRGLHYLHKRHIVHFDLKSGNILLARDGTAKLADVGLARSVTTQGGLTAKPTDIGTFSYCAPEVLTGGHCSEKSDIYSLGVVLWEICTGETPNRGSMRDVNVPEECPAEVAQLIDWCMAADPTARPSARQVLLALEGLQPGGGDALAAAQSAQQAVRQRSVRGGGGSLENTSLRSLAAVAVAEAAAEAEADAAALPPAPGW